jgi:hypothetical protein
MKHLLNGVAIAAVMAFAMPALAQNAPMTPSTPPKAAPAPAPMPPASQTQAPAPMAKKPVHHVAMHHHMGMGGGDKMTEQLNQQELQRIQSGAPPSSPAPMPAPMPSNYETPGKPDMPPMAAPPPPAH